jgi:hypothetical protein
MDFLKPPTDNLYKFVAITGFVLTVVPPYLAYRFDADSYLTIHEYEREVGDVLSEYHAIFVDQIRPDQIKEVRLVDETIPFQLHRLNTDEDLQKIINHLEEHDHKLFMLSAFPKKDDDVARELWTTSFRLSPEAYDALIQSPSADNLISKVNSQARLLRPKHQRIIFTVVDTVTLADDVDVAALYAFGAMAIGIVLMIVGFALWYIRVQRPQDRILASQLAAIGKDNLRP